MCRFLPLAALFAAACTPTNDAPQPERPAGTSTVEEGADVAAPAASAAESTAAFGVALYQRLAGESGNIFVSPVSIAGAFAPVSEGALGETRAAIERTLRFPTAGAGAIGALLRDALRERPGVTLSIANALWV